MQPAFQSFVAGFPFLVLHLGVALAMLAAGTAIYIRITPHKEIRLIREGNLAAAISLSGAILGLALPLAFCLATSVNVWDIVIWGVVTLLLQITAFRVIDGILQGLSQRIESGELGAAVLLAAVKLAVAALNAAAVTG